MLFLAESLSSPVVFNLFLLNRLLTGTLLQNRPPLMILVLAKILF